MKISNREVMAFNIKDNLARGYFERIGELKQKAQKDVKALKADKARSALEKATVAEKLQAQITDKLNGILKHADDVRIRANQLEDSLMAKTVSKLNVAELSSMASFMLQLDQKQRLELARTDPDALAVATKFGDVLGISKNTIEMNKTELMKANNPEQYQQLQDLRQAEQYIVDMSHDAISEAKPFDSFINNPVLKTAATFEEL
jgi:hypothetical protein